MPCLALLAQLARTSPDLRVLHLSGHPADLLKPYGLVDSDTAMVHKPFTVGPSWATSAKCSMRTTPVTACRT
jgi:hypothetical protein